MFPVVDVRGFETARERGEAYGQQAQKQIKHCLETYANLFALLGMDWEQAKAKANQYRPKIEEFNASYIEEIAGIAAGARVDFDDVLVLNCRTELLANKLSDPSERELALKKNRDFGFDDWCECTAVCLSEEATSDGHTILAQNWDWKMRQKDALIILNTKDNSGCLISSLTEAGQLAKMGLNSFGLAVGLNLIRSANDGKEPGLPVHCVLRHLLSLPSLDAARISLTDIYNNIGFAAASNIPCADSTGGVACLEISPDGWGEGPVKDGIAMHTNHFLNPNLLHLEIGTDLHLSSVPRLRKLQELMTTRPVTADQLRVALRDESEGAQSICRAADPASPSARQNVTVASVWADLTACRLWVAPGRPSQADFEEVPTGFAPPPPPG